MQLVSLTCRAKMRLTCTWSNTRASLISAVSFHTLYPYRDAHIVAEVSELFTLVDADAVGLVDVPCEDETGMHSDKYTCFTDLGR